MIELRATVRQGKPIIPLVDPDGSRGGLTKQAIYQQLCEADASYPKWGFDSDGPCGEELYSSLFEHEPIDWNRIGHFQDVTLRLIAQRLLPAGRAACYVQGELGTRVRTR